MASGVIHIPLDISIAYATKNSSYVGSSWLYVTKIGKLVNVSGRFQVSTEKPSGQANYLFSVPAAAGIVIEFTTANGKTLVINSEGKLTSNDAIPTGNYNVQFTYVTS